MPAPPEADAPPDPGAVCPPEDCAPPVAVTPPLDDWPPDPLSPPLAVAPPDPGAPPLALAPPDPGAPPLAALEPPVLEPPLPPVPAVCEPEPHEAASKPAISATIELRSVVIRIDMETLVTDRRPIPSGK